MGKISAATAKDTKSRIPQFKTIQEEADFWDVHSTTEFEDEWQPMEGPLEVLMYRAAPKKALTVRLEPDLIEMLSDIARTKGVGTSTLARMWIMDQLRSARARPPKRKRSKGAA